MIIHPLRNGTAARDLAILDLLQLEELGLAPGCVTVQRLRRLWGISQPQVSRRMAAVHELGVYWVQPGGGQYQLLTSRPITAAERWEAVRRQLQEVAA